MIEARVYHARPTILLLGFVLPLPQRGFFFFFFFFFFF